MHSQRPQKTIIAVIQARQQQHQYSVRCIYGGPLQLTKTSI